MRPLLDCAKIDFRAVVGIRLSLRRKKSAESYLKCNACTREFIPADRDIENILFDLKVDPSVPPLIKQYHGKGVTVTDLLTARRTAIVRKAHHYRSYVSVSAARGEIIICFRHGGLRTFGTFARKRDKAGGGDRYIFKGLSKA